MPIVPSVPSIVNGVPAINTLLQILTGSPATYRGIANMGDITGPGFSLALVDVTSHSNGSPWDAFIGTIFSGGDLGFPLFFVPSSPIGTSGPIGHDAASGYMKVFLERAERTYQNVFPDTAATTAGPFNAILYKFNIKSMVKDVLRCDATIRITGEPTLTFGT